MIKQVFKLLNRCLNRVRETGNCSENWRDVWLEKFSWELSETSLGKSGPWVSARALAGYVVTQSLGVRFRVSENRITKP